MTTKTAKVAKTTKLVKKIMVQPKLTWPLPDSVVAYVKDEIYKDGHDVPENECPFKWEEVKTLSQNVKIFKIGEDSLIASYLGTGTEFVIVDVETKTVFLDAIDECVGSFLREACNEPGYDSCSFSFNALARLITGKVNQQFISSDDQLKAFSKLDFSIVDFDADEILKVDSENQMVKKAKALKKEMKLDYGDIRIDGYSVYSWSGKTWQFHKPSSVLVRLGMKTSAGLNHFILSVDEGTYFGCMLPKDSRPETIAEAFRELVPVKFRTLRPHQYLRQGEWFFHKTCSSKECVEALLLQHYVRTESSISLPKQDIDSNDHLLVPDGTMCIMHCSDDLFKIYSCDRVVVQTNDHFEVSLSEGIWEIRQNTALVSVSEEGLD